MKIVNFNEEISKVANELYERSGRIGGCDLANWFEAERTEAIARYRQQEALEAEKPAPPKKASTTEKSAKKTVTRAKKTKA